jgi:SAM-dependent MidA family methyltransferase
MEAALYGPGGFFGSGTAAGPAGHFRTSVHTTPAFATAILALIEHVDEALGRPDPLQVVDVGAGRGELLIELASQAARAAPELAGRLRLTAVELAPRPAGLPSAVQWRDSLPDHVTGVVLATEWLDNVPLDVVEVDPDGVLRYVLVEPCSGVEELGDPVSGADREWLARWWPLVDGADGSLTGQRAEIGHTRDAAWAAAVSTVERGLALCVDYGHLAAGDPRGDGTGRPLYGTLTGFRAGRQVPPTPDGSCDVTAHVAFDSVAEAGNSALSGAPVPVLLNQREALRALGAGGARPPLALAGTDPAGYVRALAAASTVAELTDPAGLGGHHWLIQPLGVPAGAATRWTGGAGAYDAQHDRGGSA